MESFKEFVDKVLKRSGKGLKKTRGNNPTIYECYNWVRDKYLKPAGVKGVYREEFYRIIKAVNTLVKEAYLDGYEVVLPNRVLQLKVQVKEGGRYISWIKTLKAWYEDPTLKEDKICIRNDKVNRIAVLYGRVGYNIKNHKNYMFIPNRKFVMELSTKYNEGNLNII